jgi:uncharacterized membrane protein
MAMSDQNSTLKQPTPRKWLGPVLLLSLVVNLFLGAHFVVGMVRHFGHEGREGATALGLPIGAVMRALNEDERKSFRELMRPQRRELIVHFREVRAARLALSEAVAATPYDPEAARQAFQKLRNAMGGVASTSQTALADAFSQLSPETRARIAEALKQPRRSHSRFEERSDERHERNERN